ncbi:hypothetical protein M8J77_023293 [Diaphorina citri]|nr:hypothetical protein M8J77_023293 [Diaphorina citri]
MSGSLSMIESKNELLQTMSEADQVKYFKLMQLWFQQKINKTTYDKEITKLLNKTQNELHKRFILIFLHKHVTYSKHKYMNFHYDEENNKQEFESKPNVNVNGASEQFAHVDKKMKVSHETEYYFEPADIFPFVPPVNVDYDQNSLLTTNKDSYLMGLLQVIAWQQGIQDGAPNKEIGALVQYAVNTFIKNLLTTIVTQKKTFKVKGSNFICDIGKHMPNPWLKSSHIYRTQQSSRYPLVKIKSYLSEKRSLLKNENFHTAMDIANSVQFNLLNKKPNHRVSLEDVLYVVMNNVNNVIPLQDLQYTLYENILPTRTPT